MDYGVSHLLASSDEPKASWGQRSNFRHKRDREFRLGSISPLVAKGDSATEWVAEPLDRLDA